MEAQLINAVINIQRLTRGFLARRCFERMLADIYLKESGIYAIETKSKTSEEDEPIKNTNRQLVKEYEDPIIKTKSTKINANSKTKIRRLTADLIHNNNESEYFKLELKDKKNKNNLDIQQFKQENPPPSGHFNMNNEENYKNKKNSKKDSHDSENSEKCSKSKESQKSETLKTIKANTNISKLKELDSKFGENSLLSDIGNRSRLSNASLKKEVYEINGNKTLNLKTDVSAISFASYAKPIGRSLYTPKSEKLKPIYYDFDVYLKAATQIQKVFRGFLSRRYLIDYYVLKQAIQVIEMNYLYYRETKKKRIKDFLIIMTAQQKKILQYFNDLQLAELKFNKICPDKNVNKVRQNFRSKLQTVYEQFMKTRKEVNNQETQTEPIENSLKRGLAELKENENRITSSKDKKKEPRLCCCLKEKQIVYLEQKIEKLNKNWKEKEVAYCKKVVELQNGNDVLRNLQKSTLIKFIKGISLLREKMEAFNTQQKSGNYEEITKLAQDILIKINKDISFDQESISDQNSSFNSEEQNWKANLFSKRKK